MLNSKQLGSKESKLAEKSATDDVSSIPQSCKEKEIEGRREEGSPNKEAFKHDGPRMALTFRLRANKAKPF